MSDEPPDTERPDLFDPYEGDDFFENPQRLVGERPCWLYARTVLQGMLLGWQPVIVSPSMEMTVLTPYTQRAFRPERLYIEEAKGLQLLEASVWPSSAIERGEVPASFFKHKQELEDGSVLYGAPVNLPVLEVGRSLQLRVRNDGPSPLRFAGTFQGTTIV